MKFRIFICLLFACFQMQAQTTIADSIQFDNRWRTFRLFLPSSYSDGQNLPLVFNLHGYGSNALEQEIYSGFDGIANTANVLVCYPNGLNNSWNFTSTNPDDIGFIDTLITIFRRQYRINLNRVYATGMSNGGFMCNALACELSNRIAAIAPVAGTSTSSMLSTCSPVRKVPVLYIHGTADQVVSYEGSLLFTSAYDLMELWSNRNQCSIVSDTLPLPDISPGDNCTAQRISWSDCMNNSEVVHYRILNGGHTWPGSSILIGITNMDFNASHTIWEFFSRHSLNNNFPATLDNVSLFPNPFQSGFSIRLPFPAEALVKIYSSDGRLIHSALYSQNPISISGISPDAGLYFVNVIYNGYSKSIRLVHSR